MGQLDRLEGSRSPGWMTNGAEGLIRKKDEGLTQQGLWMAAGKLLMCLSSGRKEVRGQGSGVREGREINENPCAWQGWGQGKLSGGFIFFFFFFLALFH